jgi:phthiocerol/phenolphthiocerol synthesis type-I polyketide synthase E
VSGVPAHSDYSNAVAIVGMAGRFPGAADVEAFWRNLRAGVESIATLSDEQMRASGFDDEKVLRDPRLVRRMGVLDGVDQFDAAFFDYSGREAAVMDPQQRVFLECAWEAIEHAGYDPKRIGGERGAAVGVFAGLGINRYLLHHLRHFPGVTDQLGELELLVGGDKDFLATRLAYKLDLRGPAVTVQTACSTSLAAVVMACQSLLGYGCDVALAGGVAIHVPSHQGYVHHAGGTLSPDGRCRPFDAKAAGLVPGNGAGIVVLKRAADAIAHGDTVYAVIRGAAMNNDGAGKVGYTAPSVEGQAQVISTAQALAGVAPETISYVEAHGTGTSLGDPVEVAGLAKAFGPAVERGSVAIGSVKANIGHLDVAAGVAGLIKATMALREREIPASLHFETPNPKLEIERTPFFVNASLRRWERRAETPRRAGVSSFGIGGTNAHVVLEEAPETADEAEANRASRSKRLLVLSARTPTALAAARERPA